MDTEVKAPLARGWLESVGQPHGSGAVPIIVRGDGQVRTVWLAAECAQQLPPLQSVIVITECHADNTPDAPATMLEVIHAARPIVPVGESADDWILKRRHLEIRSPLLRATAQFRHLIQKYAREHLESLGCINVHTPILVEATCVCSGDVFSFPYYGRRIATLIQSPWMYVDVMTSGVERAYALNPSFRRERAATNIHLVEIWQLQVDMAWMTNDEIIDVEEGLVRALAYKFQERHSALYEQAGLDWAHLSALRKSFARITYDESLDILKRNAISLEYGSDYSQAHSDVLSAQFDRPYFITHFPKKLKNFWFPACKDQPGLTPSNDLFAHTGHGELIGGGERVTDSEELERNLAYYKHDLDEFEWFVETRRHGCVPHAGFSVGFDRLTAFLMGVRDIRQATLFPRVPMGTLVP